MRVLLFFIIITLLARIINAKENFCNLSNLQICKFINLKLPIEKNFTLPEIKLLGESRAKDLYNEIFNSNNPRLSDAISKNMNLSNFLKEICYVHTDNEVDGIVNVINDILLNYFNNDNTTEMLTNIQSTDTILKFSKKINFLRYKKLNNIFDDLLVSNSLIKEVNFKIIKFHTFYLILEEKNIDYIQNNLRLGVYNFLYDKNVFFISDDIDSDNYQYLTILFEDVIIKYIENIFGKVIQNINELSIIKIRNLLNNGELIDYFLLEKDLCYI